MADQLVAQIEEYLRGKASLDDLTRWVLSNLQSILDSGDREAVRLANAVDTELIRFSEELLTVEALEDRLRSLAGRQTTIPFGKYFSLAAESTFGATGSLTVRAFPKELTTVENLLGECRVG